MDHGDEDHHGGHALWQWRSPCDNGQYCHNFVNAIPTILLLHVIIVELE